MGTKLGKDQLVAKLTALFPVKRNEHEKLFDYQIATLKDRGAPEQIVEILENQKGRVLAKASKRTFFRGSNIPFLPVIPKTLLGARDLMAMVRNGGKAGHIYLPPTAIFDLGDTPIEPYYIYDVEDGSSTRDKSPENAEKTFKSQKRSPLTAAEVIALTTHTDVLSRHYVWAIGSRCWSFERRSTDRLPCVELDDGDTPGLSWGYLGWDVYPYDGWGSASCGSR